MTPTIQTEIELLQDTKSELKYAIMEKGVYVYPTDIFSVYPTRISEISMTPGTNDNLMTAIIDKSVTSVVIPEGTTKIRQELFTECVDLETVTLPITLNTIEHDAFSYCTSLTSVTIPENVSFIGDYAFYGCTAMESITCLAVSPPYLQPTYNFDNTNNCPIYVPEESVDTYKHDWSDYASRIQAIPVAGKGSMTYNSGSDTLTMPGDYICGYDSEAYPDTLRDCDVTEPINTAGIYTSDIETLTINDSILSIDVHLYGFSNLQSITCLSPYPPVLVYFEAFDSAETNSCPIYVPSASLNDYLNDSAWATYSSRLQAIPEPQPVDPYPELESVQIFKIKENLNDVTSGKYIIQSSGYILNASLIETTTGTGNGINNYGGGNTISFSGYRMGQGICQVNANTLNAAMDYDATNHTLSWTNTNNNTTYYLSQRTTTSSNFKYSGTTTVPTTTITVAQVNSNRNLTFKQNYALGYGSPAISWYNASNSSAFTGIYLYKLETVSAAPVATFTLSDTSEVKVYDYSGNNANLTFDANNTLPYASTVVEALIKRNVEEIGYGAFYNFTYLETVTIPDSVDTIGDSAFENCSSLTSLTVKATYPPTLGSGVFTNTSANLVIYVPAESVNDYKAASGWSDYASKIQAIS